VVLVPGVNWLGVCHFCFLSRVVCATTYSILQVAGKSQGVKTRKNT
jgi:hypothetical protein